MKTLQRLSGKCISFSLAVAGARLFINEINIAISKGVLSSRRIQISGPLKDEIQSWTFLETWTGHLPWRNERRRQVKLCSDASFAWGGVLSPEACALTIRDYWPANQLVHHINVKEVMALVNVIEAFSHSIRDCWVDVYTDSQVLIASWSRHAI